MSDFGQVEQPIPENEAEVRPGIRVDPPEIRDDTLENWLNTQDLNRAIAECRHLRDLTPRFRIDPAYKPLRYILEDYAQYFQKLIEEADLPIEKKIWLEIRLKHIRELLPVKK